MEGAIKNTKFLRYTVIARPLLGLDFIFIWLTGVNTICSKTSYFFWCFWRYIFFCSCACKSLYRRCFRTIWCFVSRNFQINFHLCGRGYAAHCAKECENQIALEFFLWMKSCCARNALLLADFVFYARSHSSSNKRIYSLFFHAVRRTCFLRIVCPEKQENWFHDEFGFMRHSPQTAWKNKRFMQLFKRALRFHENNIIHEKICVMSKMIDEKIYLGDRYDLKVSCSLM